KFDFFQRFFMSTGADGQSAFSTTHWSVVLQAGASDAALARAALETLCHLYWFPVYAYVRRAGEDASSAQDLTQDFFADLLARQSLCALDPARGRFRSFLLGSLRHFLANKWDRRRTQKRGGGRAPLSLDFDLAEQRYGHEPADLSTPEMLYHRRWAL